MYILHAWRPHAHAHEPCVVVFDHEQVGWKHQETIKELEAKRKVKSTKFYEAKKRIAALRAKAVAQVEGAK